MKRVKITFIWARREPVSYERAALADFALGMLLLDLWKKHQDAEKILLERLP